MLVSHRKHFIYTKTVKTAGTSVESWFEPYCMPEGEWQASHWRDQYDSEAGIIGFRGKGRGDQTWFNHMPAARIKELLGEQIWNDYYKFTTVRNPFDKLVSGFAMYEKKRETYSLTRRLRNCCNRALNRGRPIDRTTGSSRIERFQSWIKKGGMIIDRDKYMIDDTVCMDFFIRFESLREDMQRVSEHLGIPFDAAQMPGFKTGIRKHDFRVSDYYDAETEAIVRDHYQWEIDNFGYQMPE